MVMMPESATPICLTYNILRNLVCAFHASEHGCRLLRLTALCNLNCPAASTTVLAMKKSIILISALSVVAMALVSCASDSDTTTPNATTQQAAPAHDHIGGAAGWQ